jgi:hypothetical protein
MSGLHSAVITFEFLRAGERRRYRIDAEPNHMAVRELLPVHVSGYYPGMLTVDDCWSTPFRAPEPILSIALRCFSRMLRSSLGESLLLWSSSSTDDSTTVDLGTIEVDAINPPTSTSAA